MTFASGKEEFYATEGNRLIHIVRFDLTFFDLSSPQLNHPSSDIFHSCANIDEFAPICYHEALTMLLIRLEAK